MCGMCEEACPTNAIQLTPDFEMCEYDRQNMVYEKEHLQIEGTGKYHDYNFYRTCGLAISRQGQGRGPQRARTHRREEPAAMMEVPVLHGSGAIAFGRHRCWP